MIFKWLRRRRRRKLLGEPFPADWLTYLENNVAHYRLLSEAEQSRLRDLLRIFIAEKDWEGCGGQEITDEIRVTIAALACLLVLGFEEEYFGQVQTMLVYPNLYVAPDRVPIGGGLVLEGESSRLGEAHYRGPVLLAWDEVLDNARHPGRGRNLVFHEFAHQLDMLNGEIDGTPVLESERQAHRWQRIMTAEYERLIRAADRGLPTLLDTYGTQDEAEFFAVATEAFFDRPANLKEKHPKLYEVLGEYYRQDPASRLPQ